MTDAASALGDERALRIDVVRGAPSEEELGALIAVVSETLTQEDADAEAAAPRRRTAWERSQRALRQPLQRDDF